MPVGNQSIYDSEKDSFTIKPKPTKEDKKE